MILRRMEEGAEKCALRDLRREEETSTRIEQGRKDNHQHTSNSILVLHPTWIPHSHPRSHFSIHP